MDRMGRHVRRKLIVALLMATSAAELFAYLFGFVGGSSRPGAPARRAPRPTLPAVWIDASQADTPIAIAWRRSDGRTAETDECDLGRRATRGWSDGGDVFEHPDAYEFVCVDRSRFVAWAMYKRQSLPRGASEDWPNFEPFSDARTVPREASALNGLRADQWEISCGLGDPNTPAEPGRSGRRYDEVLVVIELRTIDVGLGFAAIRRLVPSVDRDLAAKMR